MPCISKVVVIRNTGGGVIDMVLLCEGGCADGSCMIVNDMKSAAPVSDAELGQQGIVKQPGKVYVKYTERCACMDDRGTEHEEVGEPPLCCRIVLHQYCEELKTPGFATVLLLVKKVMACERVDAKECKDCTCRLHRLPGKEELVDGSGEFIGTKEIVVCKCL